MGFEEIFAEVLDNAEWAFTVLLVVDMIAFWVRRDKQADRGRHGYGLKDTATNLVIRVAGTFIAPYAGLLGAGMLIIIVAEVTPWQWSMHHPVLWLLVLLMADLAYYAEHRTAHRVRILWATHSVHHSSRRFNLSTAYRLGIFGATDLLGYLWYVPIAAIGAPPSAIFLTRALTIIVQIPIHTERIDRMWAPIEWTFNTPSNHRVHHGANNPYLDKNFGGLFMIWDHLFGTYVSESEPVRYGLVHNIETHNPIAVYFHEFRAIGRDLRHAHSLGEVAGYLFRPPGWQPARTDRELVDARIRP